MGMTPDHFGIDRGQDVGNVKRSGFAGHLTVENDLQSEIAQFITQVAHVAALNRVCDLVSLFDRVGDDRREVLFDIPRTAGFRVTQLRHNLCQLYETFSSLAHSRKSSSASRVTHNSNRIINIMGNNAETNFYRSTLITMPS